ncbi:hypothetical protein G3578_19930 [Brevibacillus sp. SYP-B805]|uniref:hypothetical protein n=1 Tax=Brevibacillus sp. SYP-B805 TaxID=1578199 RepID=UPI0013ECECC9|nr:hypothetical protein [Brevibacillus sp. SYP-B805]NGQ97412.1 hypothetical protein [Brevibacillus sp. SYP-B805]
MFHPTVFDNVKVVLEGAVYDCDFEGAILVTDRSDIMDMATFHRLFDIEFCLAHAAARDKPVTARIQLRTTLADIAAEQLEQPLTERIGCMICIHFRMFIRDVAQEAAAISRALNDIWGNRPHITQFVGARLDEHWLRWPPELYETRVTLDFQRKIDEGNIEDMRRLVDHCVASLDALEQLQRL